MVYLYSENETFSFLASLTRELPCVRVSLTTKNRRIKFLQELYLRPVLTLSPVFMMHKPTVLSVSVQPVSSNRCESSRDDFCDWTNLCQRAGEMCVNSQRSVCFILSINSLQYTHTHTRTLSVCLSVVGAVFQVIDNY